MQYNIEIQPAGIHYKSKNNLLDDAIEQSIPLEHSCKTGDCGACSADIISGLAENEYGKVVDSGSILTCQSKAKSDIILKANYYPELVHIKQQTIPCKVASVEYPTNDVVVLKFRFPPTAKFDYLPGQYVDLSFKGVKRSYSIANAHCENKELELHIRKVENGQMSSILFDNVKLNQLMRIEGPKGTFFIKDNKKPLILIATGTGIAPVKAILEDLIAKSDTRNVSVYWGMRKKQELYCNAIEEMLKNNSNIKFYPVLSQDDDWNGHKGYVQNAVCHDIDSLIDYDVYACGSPQMITDAQTLFLKNKLPQNAFYFDAFTPAK